MQYEIKLRRQLNIIFCFLFLKHFMLPFLLILDYYVIAMLAYGVTPRKVQCFNRTGTSKI